ncbi:unnamed protein product [Sphagnum tenellum]
MHVFSIGRHFDQLVKPLAVQCVKKLDDHVEHVLGGVALEHGDDNQVELFIIAEENIANDCVDNVNRNDEFNRVCDQVHVLVQSVDAFHLALEVLCFVLVRQRLAGGPRLGVLFQMATIVEGSERLREIFDGQGRFSLIAQTIANLHTIPTFVDAKKASHDHISFGILGDDLKAEVQGVLRMEWGRLHGCTDEQKC